MRVARGRYLARASASVGQAVAPAATGIVSLLAVLAAGVATWGAFLGAMIVVRLCAQVANFGSRDRLLREFAREPSGIAQAWARGVAARAWLVLPAPVVFLITGAEPGRAALMTVWLAATFAGQSYDALITYRRDFAFAMAIELVGTTILAGTILVAGPRVDADLLVAAFAIVAVLRAGGLAWRFGVPGVRGWSWSPNLGELRASTPFFVLTFSGALQSRVDLYIVAALLPPAALGAYGVLTGFVALVQSSSAALLAPLVPPLYRIARSSLLALTTRFAVAGVGISLLGIVVTWACLVVLYRIELPPPAIVAAWATMLPCFAYAPLVYLWFRTGRPALVVAGSLLGIGVGVAGGLVLTPRFGIAGAMVSAALAQAAIAAFHVAGALWPPAGVVPATDARAGP